MTSAFAGVEHADLDVGPGRRLLDARERADQVGVVARSRAA